MPLIEPNEEDREEKLDFVVGRARDILYEMYAPDGTTPLDTTGWECEAWFYWNKQNDDDSGQTTLTGDSAIQINNAGVISGQIQPDALDDVPRGRRAWLVIDVIPGPDLEHWTIKMPIRLVRAPE